MDALPWIGGAGGLLIGGRHLRQLRRTADRLHLRFWYLPRVLLILGLFAGTFYVFKEKVRTGGFWRPQPKEQIVVYCERPVGTDVKLSSETIKLFEHEVLPLPEGVPHAQRRLRATGPGSNIEFEDELLQSAYPGAVPQQVHRPGRGTGRHVHLDQRLRRPLHEGRPRRRHEQLAPSASPATTARN